MYELVRTNTAIDDVVNKAAEVQDSGRSRWPGMTFEQGVKAAIEWLIGDDDHNPMDD